MNPFKKETLNDLLKQKSNGQLHHRESQILEFKESFNLNGLAEYFKDFAAFSNNQGGYMIFGVTNSPRTLVGLSSAAADQFEKIDEEKITGFLLEIFSGKINWSKHIFSKDSKKFGVFYIEEAQAKPSIAKKDEGRDQEIKNGEIYYRYAGRTQKIEYAELNFLIENRVKTLNTEWMSLMSKIAQVGPENAAILDTERGLIEKSQTQALLIDETLLRKIKFIKEGSFDEVKGAQTLKIVGDVRPINQAEVVKTVHRRLIDQYPFSCARLIQEIRKEVPTVNQNHIYEIIKEQNVKQNINYSAYNFRSKEQEETAKAAGKIPSGVPSIYNQNAVNFIIRILKNKNESVA